MAAGVRGDDNSADPDGTSDLDMEQIAL
jgi:hypothetical protein